MAKIDAVDIAVLLVRLASAIAEDDVAGQMGLLESLPSMLGLPDNETTMDALCSIGLAIYYYAMDCAAGLVFAAPDSASRQRLTRRLAKETPARFG